MGQNTKIFNGESDFQLENREIPVRMPTFRENDLRKLIFPILDPDFWLQTIRLRAWFFRADSEFRVKFSGFRRPGGKFEEKLP